MSDALLAILRLLLLVLLYLFFLRVVRAVWVEIKTPAPAVAGTPSRRDVRAARKQATPAQRTERGVKRVGPRLVLTDPPEARGRIYDLGDSEVTIGRAAACTVTVDDTFVSQLHARVSVRDGQIMVEDTGSTNGTYLNRRKVGSPMVMRPGDKVQVGNTILELQ